MPSDRENRWFPPPPVRTAYFSRTRSNGVVFRVSRMRVPNAATRSTYAAVVEATPERCWRKFRATRRGRRPARPPGARTGQSPRIRVGKSRQVSRHQFEVLSEARQLLLEVSLAGPVRVDDGPGGVRHELLVPEPRAHDG